MARLTSAQMPTCEMARVVLHWTAGTYKASALDREHYHLLIEGDGTVVAGSHSIERNAKPVREPRASHTRNSNTGSIGVAVCCMKDAREKPFSAGSFPMTVTQWQVAAEVVAELCTKYGIEVTPRTVLAHGEVQATLKIEQLQKWDPLVLPWRPTTPRQQVMDEFRASVRDHVERLSGAGAAPAIAAAAGPFEPQKLDWPGDRAVLLVHGVGNAAPGDYTDLVEEVRNAVGPDIAIYSLYYDVFNDWFAEKTKAAEQVGKLVAFVRQKQNPGELAQTIAEFAGDVIWPLFSTALQATVMTAYRAQLRQMVLDGTRSTGGKLPGELKMSIVCHSLGCFHTYEILHEIAASSTLNLRPATDGVRFRSVVFMASPVQLIRTLAQSAGVLIPGTLACAAQSGLAIPSEDSFGTVRKSVRRWVSVTGDLDPIGGHFVRKKAPWAYMDINEPEVIAKIDRQTLIGSGDVSEDLRSVLRSALSTATPPDIKPNNPHSWLAYTQRHAGELAGWFA